MAEPRCAHLRSRLDSLLGREAAEAEDQVPVGQYWCAKTTTVLGPDEVYCSARSCTARRPCFEAEEP
jgi:hypothetical protein